MEVPGSTFLITGGGSGLGAACAQLAVARGARVVLVDRREEAGTRLAGELGDAARFVRADVTDESAVLHALDLATQAFGRIDVAINCAGIGGGARVVGKEGPHDLAQFGRVVQVNLIGTFNVIRLAAQRMAGNPPQADGERGVIVNTASVAAFDGQIGQAAYSASKGGIVSMTLPIARELARFGIRVVTIAPGVFQTPMMEGMQTEMQQALAAQVPFPPRLGQPEEFAELVSQIVANRMLNGTTIRLDGALRMSAR